MAESILKSIDTISKELQNLTLTGVERVDKDPLGSGAYGKVFAVRHEERTYAAKEIHLTLLEGVSPEAHRVVRENFLKECYQCSILHHPNIVQFIGVYFPRVDYPDPHSLPIMVMELMDTSLTEYIKTANISMRTKASILHDIAQGLYFLHSHNPPVIHRDLSPNNILLSHDTIAKIGDLGVAKVVTADKMRKLTKAPGTKDFMPPEALNDDPKYSTDLDIFSYGGLTLHVVSQVWPAPTRSIEYNNKMKPVKMLTEVERRQVYIDMTGEQNISLKSLAIRCLDNDCAKRPKIGEIVKILETLKVR